jgi:hypothetical protein
MIFIKTQTAFKMKRIFRNYRWYLFFLCLLFAGCSSPLIETNPAEITDTSTVTITCNAEIGNKALMDFKEPVYVHVGLITDSSIGPTYWRYVKFKWGSTDEAAIAKPAGKNKWSYEIPNIRKFFAVAENEKIQKLAILFRQGNCIDTLCKTLRNKDKSDIFIPIKQNK